MRKKEGPWVVGVTNGADATGFRMQKTQNDSQPLQGPGPTRLSFTTEVSPLGDTSLGLRPPLKHVTSPSTGQ